MISALPASESSVTVYSRVLGDLCLSADSIITFRHGLLGFPLYQRFAIVPSERDGMFWLQSLDDRSLTFLLADPFHFFRDFEMDLPDAVVETLDATVASDLLVLAVVTLVGGMKATANLQGPLVINMRTRLAQQVALSDPDARVHAPIVLNAAVAA